jgi:lambda repressor-like predicted transcriptional regulator
MDYPQEFDHVARAKMVAAEIEASRKASEFRPYQPSEALIPGTPFRRLNAPVFQYILTVFRAFANEACVLGRSGIWATDRIDAESREFLRVITIEAQEKYRSRSEFYLGQLAHHGSLIPKLVEFFEASPEWQHYQNDLLEVARLHAQAPRYPGPAFAPSPADLAELINSATNEAQESTIEETVYDPVKLRSEQRSARVLPLLKKKGMTPSGLATKTGLDPSVVYDYLSGKSKPRPANRNLIAEVLGVPESELPD